MDEAFNKGEMKRKFKEGDVVMILPHSKKHSTRIFIGDIGFVVYKSKPNKLIVVQMNMGDITFLPQDWGMEPSHLLKIGKL